MSEWTKAIYAMGLMRMSVFGESQIYSRHPVMIPVRLHELILILIAESRTMGRLILYCRSCSGRYVSTGEIPVTCAACGQPAVWTTYARLVARSPDDLDLTDADIRLLKTFNIEP